MVELASTTYVGCNYQHLRDLLAERDGSRHAWLEERGPWLCLLAAIDDATGKLAAALFREEEDASLLLSLSAADAGAARSASGALP